MQPLSFLAGPRPRVLAHRGNMPGHDENTLDAFRSALGAGADIIESDVQVTRDGVPILFHDESLRRLTGDPRLVADVDWQELARMRLTQGGRIASLAEALHELPEARFNLDLKSPCSPQAACSVVTSAHATGRVLLTSFSERQRRHALDLVPSVASSASARRFFGLLVAGKLGCGWLARRLARDICAVQIPLRVVGLSTATPRFIRRMHAAGLEVHFWVVDSPDTMRALLRAGADGIVTDATPVARCVVDKFLRED